jgi:hypothetical protein
MFVNHSSATPRSAHTRRLRTSRLRSATRAMAVAGGLSLVAGTTLVGFANPAAAAEAKVNLGTAAPYSVLGSASVTNTGPSVLSGDVGLSPGSALSGFPPGVALGTTHVNDANASQAQTDLVTGYNDAAGRTSTATVSGDLGGQTLVGGVYSSASTMALTGTLTLDAQGNRDTVFIFQVGSALTTASSSSVSLLNGAQACNVFWQVGSSATLGTTSAFVGSIIALTSVTVTTGATVEGRALARSGSVTLDSNTFTTPGCLTGSATTTTTTAVAGTTTTAVPAAAGDSGTGDGSTPTDTGAGTPAGGSDTGQLAQTGPSRWTGTLLMAGGLTALAGAGLVADARRRTRTPSSTRS